MHNQCWGAATLLGGSGSRHYKIWSLKKLIINILLDFIYLYKLNLTLYSKTKLLPCVFQIRQRLSAPTDLKIGSGSGSLKKLKSTWKQKIDNYFFLQNFENRKLNLYKTLSKLGKTQSSCTSVSGKLFVMTIFCPCSESNLDPQHSWFPIQSCLPQSISNKCIYISCEALFITGSLWNNTIIQLDRVQRDREGWVGEFFSCRQFSCWSAYCYLTWPIDTKIKVSVANSV